MLGRKILLMLALRCRILVLKLCTDLDLSLLYIWYSEHKPNLYRKINVSARCLPFAAQLERWSLVCGIKITFTVLQRTTLFPQQKNRWNALQTGFHWESLFVRPHRKPPSPFLFGRFAATQLALRLHQKRTQVVCSNREARKRPARGHSRNWPWDWKAYAHICRQTKEN